MNFNQKLEQEHSKKITLEIVNEVFMHPKRIDDLMDIILNGPSNLSQRAAWPMSYIFEEKPHLITPYFNPLIKLLNQPNKHDAINRNILRSLQFASIPKKFQGAVLDSCFKLLTSSQEPIAIKIFSMTIIHNLSKEYPDIIPELKSSIETILPNASTGTKNRAYKILKQIS